MDTKNRFASAETNDEINTNDHYLMRGGGKKVVIHPSLRKYPKLNYVKIQPGLKRCTELRWNTRVMNADNSSLREHLDDGGMYGIQANNSFVEIDGIDRPLIILDWDNREFQDKVIDKFPKTLKTSSGSPKNCNHLILATDKNEKKFSIIDKDGNTLMDVLGRHGQIVAPNSIHTSGSIYKIVEDLPIAYIPYAKVLEILNPYISKKPERVIVVEERSSVNYSGNSFFDQVKKNLSISDVLEKNGIDTQKNPTECPLHPSVKGECFSFSDSKGKWMCHHGGCGKAGNVFMLVKHIYGLGNKETFEKLAELTGLEDELKEEQSNYMKREARE